MPEMTVVNPSVFVTAISTWELMAVVSVSELLVLSSSVWVPVTVAVLLKVPVAVGDTFTLMVMVAVAPLAILPKLAVTVPALLLTVP